MVYYWSERRDRIIRNKLFFLFIFLSPFLLSLFIAVFPLYFIVIFILLSFFTSFSYSLCSCSTFLQCLLYLIAVSLSFLFDFYRFFSYCVSPFLSYVVAYVSVDVSNNKEESNSHLYVWIRMSSTGPVAEQRQLNYAKQTLYIRLYVSSQLLLFAFLMFMFPAQFL